MEELTYITITCIDDKGVVVQTCDEKIKARVSNALESWLGTGNPKPEYNYLDMETYMWNGRALLVVRKNEKNDSVNITLTSSNETVNISI